MIVISAIRQDYIYISNEDDLCANSGQRIHPMQVMPFRRNKKIADNDDDDDLYPEKFRDTVRIPKQELDHMLYDNYTRQYGIQRGQFLNWLKTLSMFMESTVTGDSSHVW